MKIDMESILGKNTTDNDNDSNNSSNNDNDRDDSENDHVVMIISTSDNNCHNN